MAFANPYIRRALDFSPDIFDRLIANLPPEAMDARPDPDRFTVREALCHLADWEPFFLERVKGTVTEDNFQIVPYDEGKLAIERDYAHQDPQAALARFRAGRKAFLAYVDTLTPDDLDQMAFHPERGHMSASDQLNLTVGHDMYHIEQITARL